jgi:hypothetical protein
VLTFAVAFALLAIPLSHLTFARLDETPMALVKVEKQENEKVPTFMRVRLAHKPSTLSLTVDGKELLSADQQKPQELDLSLEAPLTIPAEGVEIFAKATWPEGTPDTAVTIDLEPSEKDPKSQTNWSAGTELGSAYLFQWKP